MVPDGVLRIHLKFYKELEYRFWEYECQINMGLYGDWYILPIENQRVSPFLWKLFQPIKTNLRFSLFAKQSYSPVFKKNRKKFEKWHFTA